MTTYTAITAGQIDGDSPVDTVLAGQWTNNLLAIQEGDASAPKIATAALAEAPNWPLLEAWTITATANHIFTFDESAYSDVRIVVENAIPATDGMSLWVRLGHTDGGTIAAGATDYAYEYRDSGDTAFTADTTSNTLPVAANVGTAANEGVSGTIETIGMTSIVGPKGVRSFMVNKDIVTLADRRTLDGHCNSAMTTAFDSVQLLWSSGNFEASGTVYMYGLKKA